MMKITDEAVHAAASAVYGSGLDGSIQRDAWLRDFRIALEAVAPLMLADAWAEGHGVGRTDEWSLEPNPYDSTR